MGPYRHIFLTLCCQSIWATWGQSQAGHDEVNRWPTAAAAGGERSERVWAGAATRLPRPDNNRKIFYFSSNNLTTIGTGRHKLSWSCDINFYPGNKKLLYQVWYFFVCGFFTILWNIRGQFYKLLKAYKTKEVDCFDVYDPNYVTT